MSHCFMTHVVSPCKVCMQVCPCAPSAWRACSARQSIISIPPSTNCMPCGGLQTGTILLCFAGYLLWTKLTNAAVLCPVGGCSSILNSPYAQIGPLPLPALGVLGYSSVAGASWLARQQRRGDAAFDATAAYVGQPDQTSQQFLLFSAVPVCALAWCAALASGNDTHSAASQLRFEPILGDGMS